MAGAAIGNLGAVAMAVVGLVSVVRARRAGRGDKDDAATDKRLAERLEMERRMASYLAARETEPAPRNDKPRSER